MHLTCTLAAIAWLAATTPQAEVDDAGAPVTREEAPATSSEERAARAAETAAKAAASMAEASDRIARALERLAAEKEKENEKEVPAPVDVPLEPPPPQTWTGSVGIGLISITGNASTLTLNGNAVAERKSKSWIFGGRASGSYGQARTTDGGPAAVTALAGVLQVRGDRRFTPFVSTFLLSGAEADHVKSVELRAYGEGGMGLIWIEQVTDGFERAFFRTDLSLRAGQEYRYQYYPAPLDLEDVPLIAPKFALAFRYALSDGIRFIEEAEIFPNLIGNNSVVVSSSSKLTARLVAPFSIGIGFKVDFDSRPAPGKVSVDTTLNVGIEMAL